MRAGRMDRRVTIESYSASRDAMGGETQTWTTLATVWAEKRDTTARETVSADTEALSQIQTVWRIRYRSDVTAKMRVNDGTYLYNINGFAELGRKWGLELQCTRVGA